MWVEESGVRHYQEADGGEDKIATLVVYPLVPVNRSVLKWDILVAAKEPFVVFQEEVPQYT